MNNWWDSWWTEGWRTVGNRNGCCSFILLVIHMRQQFWEKALSDLLSCRLKKRKEDGSTIKRDVGIDKSASLDRVRKNKLFSRNSLGVNCVADKNRAQTYRLRKLLPCWLSKDSAETQRSSKRYICPSINPANHYLSNFVSTTLIGEQKFSEEVQE